LVGLEFDAPKPLDIRIQNSNYDITILRESLNSISALQQGIRAKVLILLAER